MKTRTKILFGIFILLGIGVWALLVSGDGAMQTTDNQSTSTAVTNEWATSTNESAELSMTYLNRKYEFEFDYPADWRVGDADISNGTFQLFNYEEEEATGGHQFPSGHNKIEIALTNRARPATSSVFVETDREETEVTIDTVTAVRTASTLQGGSQALSYTIPLPRASSTYLRMTAHGDLKNFGVVEQIANTFQLLYKQPVSNQGSDSDTKPTELNTYTNEGIGLSFNYPDNWQIVNDEVVGKSEYWVHLKREKGELSFNVDVNYPYPGGGFVLSDENQAEYVKVITDSGTRIWRPDNKNIASTTQLRSLERQPEAEAISNGDWTAFGYIFPKLNQTNNVGDTFDGGAGELKHGSSTLNIAGGVENESEGEVENILDEMDAIVSTVTFEEVATSSVANMRNTVVGNWKTYVDNDYNFSIQYPSVYDDLSQTTNDGFLKELYADSPETVLTAGGYNRYPQLTIRVFELESYEYDTRYGTSYRYNSEENNCIIDGERQTTTEPFDISTDDWGGCRIGTGDAGYSSSGYFIPYEQEGVVIQVMQGAYFGTRRPLNFDALVKTLELDS